MAAVTICSDFGAPQNKVSHWFHCVSICLPWNYGTRCYDLSFLKVEFKPTFSLSSFTFIKRLFSSSLLSAIRVVSSAYLRLLIFLPAILTPASASSSLALHMMYSVYKLNKQGDNMQAWRTPFLIWNQSVVPCPVLTVASWSAYRFLRKQVRWSGIPISLRMYYNLLWSTWSLPSYTMSRSLFKLMSDNQIIPIKVLQDHKEGWAYELMLSNCGAGEDSWESLGRQGDQTSQS